MKQQILNGEARVYGCREGMKEGKEENETKQKANKLVHNVNVQPNLSRRIRSFTYYYYYCDFPSVVTHQSLARPPPLLLFLLVFAFAWLGLGLFFRFFIFFIIFIFSSKDIIWKGKCQSSEECVLFCIS